MNTALMGTLNCYICKHWSIKYCHKCTFLELFFLYILSKCIAERCCMAQSYDTYVNGHLGYIWEEIFFVIPYFVGDLPSPD